MKQECPGECDSAEAEDRVEGRERELTLQAEHERAVKLEQRECYDDCDQQRNQADE